MDAITFRATTVRELLEGLSAHATPADLDAIIKLEVSGFINGGMLLSQRQDISSVTISPKGKIILHARHPEAWRAE